MTELDFTNVGPVVINVTQARIDTGNPANCWACPIALAFDAVIVPEFVVVVKDGFAALKRRLKSEEWSALIYGSHIFTIYLPQQARNFIMDYDGLSMGDGIGNRAALYSSLRPFTFEVLLPRGTFYEVK